MFSKRTEDPNPNEMLSLADLMFRQSAIKIGQFIGYTLFQMKSDTVMKMFNQFNSCLPIS